MGASARALPISCRRDPLLLVLGVLLLVSPPGLSAQSALERTPNLGGAWVGRPGQGYFNFTHRFMVVGSAQKVVNSPTLLLGAGLPGNLLAGLVYATSSDVASRPRPNELELFTRWQPLGREGEFPLALAFQGGYNTAAESVDGEVASALDLGPVRVLGAVRLLSRPFGEGAARAAVGTGAVWRLGRWAALGGDLVSLLDRDPLERVAWSAGLLLGIPYTPHTLSLHLTNANTGTLQGASRGGDQVRWGFEFTVPLTLSRFIGGGTAAAAKAASPPADGGAAAGAERAMAADTVRGVATDTVRAFIDGLEYSPARLEVARGTTIIWTNRAPLAHTVTGDDGSWGSPLLDPDGSWSHTFTTPGTYPFHCAPHPFMKGVVVVRE